MGHIWKRNGVYYMGWKDRRGKWRQKSTGVKAGGKQAKDTARAKLEAEEHRVACGEEKKLADFLGEYLKRRSLSKGPRWIQRYEGITATMIYEHSPLAPVMLNDLDVATCTKYIEWRQGHKLKKSTILKEVSWLKAAIDDAAEQGLVSWDRAYQVRRKKWADFRGANKARERVLYPHEREILFDAAKDNPNLHHAMTVAFWTGLRLGNILELVEAQVDFTCDPAVARFTPAQMKNDTGHTVLLAPVVRDLLWGLWKGVPSRRFFADFRPALKRLLAKLEKDGKLVDFRFHDFRRTYVSYRIAAGLDPKSAQDEVGHSTSKMTMDTYAKALRDPAIRAWGRAHFRFPWDDLGTVTNVQEDLSKTGQNNGDTDLHRTPAKVANL